MKKINFLFLLASLILIAILFLTGKTSFEYIVFREMNLIKWAGSLIKTYIVLLAYIAGFFAMIFIAIIDIFSSIILQLEFPILTFVYEYLIIGFSKTWYWDQFQGNYLFASALLISLVSIFILLFPEVNKFQKVVYNPGNFSKKF
jgi:hypothetical protein